MKLEARNLHFSYGDGPLLADGVDLTLEPGCFTLLLGPNGCGKSTLLRMLTGELIPADGEVLLDGKDIRKYSGRERARRIGAVMQSAPPVLDFTVREYVMTGRSPRLPALGAPGAADRAKVDSAMRTFGVELLADRPCNTLSGGERQRVMLSAAWADDPDILLLDEPTSATDPAHTLAILDHLRHRAENSAVFMITHDLNLAANCADRILLMRHGKIFAAGSAGQVLTSENILALYDMEVTVFHADDGALAILPVRKNREGV